MQPPAILESALYVTDLGAAAAFYADVLNLEKIASVPDRHVFFKCGAGILLLFDAEATRVPPLPNARLPVPPHGTTGQGHLCFSAGAGEIDAWKARLVARNVAVEAEITWPSGGKSLYFRDPSGNSLEFAEPKIWNF